MSQQLPRDLSGLDAPARLRVLDGALLDGEPDPLLQEVVTRASAVSGFPIALVSLVVRRIQFFRAHKGLPPDLMAACATDRSTSFCQFVVAADQPLLWEDALRVEGLPRDLTERYGIRAYAGFPLRVLGQTVGTLCVIDVKPARLEEAQVRALETLADEAAARLEELAKNWAPDASAPEDEAYEAFVAVSEARALLSLAEQFSAGQLSVEQFQRGLGALAMLRETLEE